jgi:signal recognition particle receptor subunit beta
VVQINFARRELSCKLIYYGPGMSGKTTNLEKVHDAVPNDAKGRFTSIATDGDRTLFFDLLPLDIGKIGGLDVKLQLYTVPGQVYYNATRKLVLRGVDGIVFVADSQPDKMAENLESLKNLEENLSDYGVKLSDLPLVMQYNKRDLPDTVPVSEMESTLNKLNWPSVEAAALNSEGVLDTLKICSELVLQAVSARTKIPAEVAATTIDQRLEERKASGPTVRPKKPAPARTPKRPPMPRQPVPAGPARISPRERIQLDSSSERRSPIIAVIIAAVMVFVAIAIVIFLLVK